ncbi:hypothetical protein DOY81_004543 [Sarcophaga bullata]|nr:hypothetical protein DOY81_004543 [Sarcophaga bullata]
MDMKIEHQQQQQQPQSATAQSEMASPSEVPNDPGKMFIGGLSWQTSPGPEYLYCCEQKKKKKKTKQNRNPKNLLTSMCGYL